MIYKRGRVVELGSRKASFTTALLCAPGMADNSDGESPSTNLIEVKVSETQGCSLRSEI